MGQLVTFDPGNAMSLSVYIDRSGIVRTQPEFGLLGVAFHPEYIYVHMDSMDWLYVLDGEPLAFRQLPVRRAYILKQSIDTTNQRVGACLDARTLLVRDVENIHLQLEGWNPPTAICLTIQSLTISASAPVWNQGNDRLNLAKTVGFSLHTDVATTVHQRRKLERLYGYIACPDVADDRLALTAQRKRSLSPENSLS